MNRYSNRYGLLFLKGLCLGAVDLIPGVSGGTFALIVGIYQELLQSLKAFDVQAIRLLLSRRWGALWQHVNASFLVPLLLGVGVSIITTVQFVQYFLTECSIQTWSFFGGILFVSTLLVYKQIRTWNFSTLSATLLGVLLAYVITHSTVIHFPHTSFYLFVSGLLASCAMLLPGISGSFVLVLLGQYTFIINAVQQLQWITLLPFGCGVFVGLVFFSRVIAWLLHWRHDITHSLLAGFMLGALNKVWPWQHLDGSSMSLGNLSPSAFQAIYHQDPLILQALLWLGLGMLLIVLLERQGRRRSK